MVFGLIALACCKKDKKDLKAEKTTNCFIKYFKSVNMLRSDFPSLGSGAVFDECTQLVNNQYQFESRQLRLGKYHFCFNSDAKIKDYFDPALLNALHADTVDDLPWTPSDVETLKDNFVDKMLSSVHSCTLDWAQDTYDKMINATFKINKKMSEEGTRDDAVYCFIKHLEEKNLLDIPILKFDKNPKGLDTNETECERIIEKFTLGIDYPEFSQKKVDMHICKHVVNFKPKYVSMYLNYFVFQSLDSDSGHRIVDRHHFYEDINPLMSYLFVCQASY